MISNNLKYDKNNTFLDINNYRNYIYCHTIIWEKLRFPAFQESRNTIR